MNACFSVPASAKALTAALEGLTALNYVLLARLGRDLPPLYESGVRYRPERGGLLTGGPTRERWQNILELYEKKHGDCEDLACALAAEYRYHDGIPAQAVVYRSGRRRFHAVVRLPDGEIEDPSKALGMKRRS